MKDEDGVLLRCSGRSGGVVAWTAVTHRAASRCHCQVAMHRTYIRYRAPVLAPSLSRVRVSLILQGSGAMHSAVSTRIKTFQGRVHENVS